MNFSFCRVPYISERNYMKKTALPLLALPLLFPSAAKAITATGNASVVIETAIATTQTQQMNFGIVTPLTAAGTVVLTSAGACSSGTLGLYGTCAPGTFTITAAPSTALTISFANGTLTGGGTSMTVDTFTTSTTPVSSTTDGSGNLTLDVGATLHVGASQVSGAYTGTYTVTVSY